MCRQKVVERKTSEQQMDTMGVGGNCKWIATANEIRWYGHVLRRDDDSILELL